MVVTIFNSDINRCPTLLKKIRKLEKNIHHASIDSPELEKTKK